MAVIDVGENAEAPGSHRRTRGAQNNKSPNAPEASEAVETVGVVGLLERIGSVALPVAIGMYALLYLGIQQVYGVFNVTPEQVGIDQATMFARLVGTLVLLVLLGALLFGPLVALGWLVDKITFGWAARATTAVRERPWAAAALGALWCGATYWGFLGYLELNEGVTLVTVVLVATAIGVLCFLVPFRLLRRRPHGRAGMKIMVGAFTGIGLGFALMGQMESDATRLATTGQPSLVLSMLGFQDQWVVASGGEDGKKLREGAQLMLLGESEGAYTFYDCAAQETFRVSMESTVVEQIALDPDRPEDFQCQTQASN